MNKRLLAAKIVAIAGFCAVVLGCFDPMEGVLLIVPGTVLLALSAWLGKTPQRWLAYVACILMVISFAFLCLLTALGGFGGNAPLLHSKWWALLLLPYPVGWMMGVASGVCTLTTLFTGMAARIVSGFGAVIAVLFLVRLAMFRLVPLWIFIAVLLFGLLCILAVLTWEKVCSKRNG